MNSKVGGRLGRGIQAREAEWWLCQQLATAGNPQAKVNSVLAETRTQG